MKSTSSHRPAQGRRQTGFTLVELMITILIGLFLIGGLLTLTSAMKRTGTVESGLGQLHDSEKLALSILSDVIQSAGYFTYPATPGTTTPSTVFPAIGTSWVAAQVISGTDGGSASAQTDTLSIRYTSAGGDGVLNCLGATSGAAVTWIAQFQVDGSGNLQCLLTTNGTAAASAVTLVSGVQYMQVLYGVQTNASTTPASVDTYLTATQVTAGTLWPSVLSIRVTLWFVNPLYCTTNCQAGQLKTVPATIPVSRNIAVMSKV